MHAHRISSHRILAALLSGFLGVLFSCQAFAQSSNNNFGSRTRLNGDNITAPAVTTTGNNREVGEPTHPGASAETLWWEWEAPQTATYTIDTDGSAIDTILAVYEGTVLNQLLRIAANDDPPGSTRARLTMTTTAGRRYQIVVAPGNTTNGNVVLKISLTGPASAESFTGNNLFNNRTRVGVTPFLGQAETTGGTRDSGEPTHPGASAETIWWEWTAPQTATYTIDTAGSTIDTIVAVYEGNVLNQLQRVVANDNPPGSTQARAVLTTTAGTTYQIVVAPGNTSNGNISLKVSFAGPASAPSFTGTESFGNRPRITALTFLGQAESNAGSDREPGEPVHTGGASNESHWWEWTSPGNGNVTIDLSAETTVNALLNTVLNVYAGSEINLLTRISSNDDIPGSVFSRVSFPTAAGQTYQIVASPGSTSNGTFRLTFAYSAVANQPPALAGTDDFLRRPTLVGDRALGLGDTTGGTRQPSEPPHTGASAESIWWQWIAPGAGTLVLDTAGSIKTDSTPFNTSLFVYRGTAINLLTLVASNDDAPGRITSRVSVPVTAGTEYQIVVAPGNTTNGNVALALEFTPAAGTTSIGSHPQSQTVAIGSSTTFTVVASGPSLTYQWQFNGGNIAGATSPSYTVNPVGATSVGRYRVIVRSGAETLTSNDAILSVIAAPTPTITIPPLLPAGGSLKQARAVAEQPGLGVLVAISGAYPSPSPTAISSVKSSKTPATAASALIVGPTLNNAPPTSLGRVVRLLADGKPDATFVSSPGADGPINTLAVDANRKILVGGRFERFHGNVLSRNLARLNIDGTADDTFSRTGSGTDAQVNAVALQADGRILVGGAFRRFGNEVWPYLIRLNVDGSIDPTFKPIINGDVNTIALQGDGRILIGGNFTSPRPRIARLLDTGAIDSSFDPGAAGSGEVVRLIIQSDGRMVAAGDFTSFGGQPRERIVRLLSSGAIDPAFSSTASANNTIFALGLQADGKMLLGGAFTKVNGVDRARVARLRADGTLDPDFDPTTGANNDVLSLLVRSDGSLFLAGLFDQYQETTVEGLVAVLNQGAPAPETPPPSITTQPQSLNVRSGAGATFTVTTTGTALNYQWQFNGTDIPGASAVSYSMASVSSSNAGSYRVVVSNFGGIVTSAAAELLVTAPTSGRLVNLSVRTTAGTGSDTLIVGFSVSGGRKQLLIRGVGPTLRLFGVTNSLADPVLSLLQGASEVASNDNWGGSATLANAFASVGAFPLSPPSLDAAVYNPLDNGSYTAQMAGKAGSSGVGLLELYDAGGGDTAARLVNLSARCQVGTGDNILIVGFNITEGPITLLVRGVGPTLGSFGVEGTLADPRLQLNSGTDIVAENDNWEPSLASTFSSVGAFPLEAGGRDAAVRVTLPPGSYTAQVSGVNGATGVALVEVYELR